MRLLTVLMLVLVLPCTGLRLVCLDEDDSGGVARTPQTQVAARGADGAACAHACALHGKRAPRPSCRIVAGDDDVCTFVIDGVMAVSPRGLDLPVALVSAPLASVPAVGAYPAPMLAPPGPPPKV